MGRVDPEPARNVLSDQTKAATLQKIEGDEMNELRERGSWAALRTREEIAQDERQRCPLCGSGEIEIHYVDDGVEPMTGYAMNGYVFECHGCGEHGEWE